MPTRGLINPELLTDIADAIRAKNGTSAGMTPAQMAEAVSNLELSEAIKQALLNCFAHVAWTDDQGQTYYDALEDALYPTAPPAELLSISAVFEQGQTVIYDTDSLDDLKPMLTVTAHYSDSTSAVVVGGYTLSGTLTEGTSTITVSYGGKTTTFDVIVVSTLVISDILTLDGIENTRNGHNASATTWEDLSGNNNDFSKYRTNVLWSENSAVFNGSNTGLSHSGVLFPTTLTAFTVEMSVKIGAIGTSNSGYPIFESDTSTFANRPGFIATIANDVKNVQVVWGIGANVPVGNDVAHLTYVFSEGKIAMYLNGEYVRTPTSNYSTAAMGRTTHFIGTKTWGDASVQYFTGEIYRFGICSRALTAEEIATRYGQLHARFG